MGCGSLVLRCVCWHVGCHMWSPAFYLTCLCWKVSNVSSLFLCLSVSSSQSSQQWFVEQEQPYLQLSYVGQSSCRRWSPAGVWPAGPVAAEVRNHAVFCCFRTQVYQGRGGRYCLHVTLWYALFTLSVLPLLFYSILVVSLSFFDVFLNGFFKFFLVPTSLSWSFMWISIIHFVWFSLFISISSFFVASLFALLVWISRCVLICLLLLFLFLNLFLCLLNFALHLYMFFLTVIFFLSLSWLSVISPSLFPSPLLSLESCPPFITTPPFFFFSSRPPGEAN